MLKNNGKILFAALLAGWLFDFLFWRKTGGISFTLYTIAIVIIGLALAYSERKAPALSSLWLLAPIGAFSLIPGLRLEPVTVFTSVCLTLAILMLLVHTFRGGRWMEYSLSDIAAVGFRLLASAIALPLSKEWQSIRRAEEAGKVGDRAGHQTEASEAGEPKARQDNNAAGRLILAILRGLLLSLPIVAILGALLASADPVFEGQIRHFFELFRLEKVIEYAWRGIYILLLAYILLGQYLHALIKSENEHLLGLDKPLVGRFLGFLEAAITLGSVNLLFLMFVIVQFQYFFGGEANISYAGLNYSQYARRGFGELVVVACFSLLLYLGLSTITRREAKNERKVYSALGVLLGLLVGVILVSAFQRLLLYESAFGFTRLRTYPHVFMVWLGLLLLVFILLEIFKRQRAFGLALLSACIGFGLSLAALNVDGLIVRQNFKHAQEGAELDLDYLLTLSFDATPALAAMFDSPELDSELKESAGAVLACQAAELDVFRQGQRWTGFHFARYYAGRLLEERRERLSVYQAREGKHGLEIDLKGETISCTGRWWLED